MSNLLTPFLRAQPMPATAVRDSFFPLIERLRSSDESIIVTRNGKPIVVLMGKATYERLTRSRTYAEGGELVNTDAAPSFSMTVTGKMQLTLPAALARKHGIKAGDQVMLQERGGRIILTPLEPLWLLKPFRRLRRRRREAKRI